MTYFRMCIFLISLSTVSLYGQAITVGTLFFDTANNQPGYNLLFPERQSVVYLTDICGQIVHRWDLEGLFPGKELTLDDEGHLLVALADPTLTTPSFGAGGAGGVIEKRSWDNQPQWRFIVRDSIYRQHHDIELMPNGNVLVIVWHRKFLPELIEMGFDTNRFTQEELWADAVWEYDPHLDSIVWTWDAWDHIIQDYDSTKANFGTIADNQRRIDINYQDWTFEKSDWLHINGIDYNAELDQIVLSPKNFNELWIIDHSISTQEAKGTQGDLMYRWGNPQAYKQGTKSEQVLFSQHDPSWIVDPQSAYYNQLLVYNNFIKVNLSLGEIFDPHYDPTSRTYPLSNGRFLPEALTRSVSHPDTIKNYSTAGSSIQLLPNGNFLMHAARPGFAFELSDDEHVVWEYKVPFRNGFRVQQGTLLSPSQNFTFSMRRYPIDFVGFDGKDLSPKGFLELNPDTLFCADIINHTQSVQGLFSVSLYPNPIQDGFLTVRSPINAVAYLYDVAGRKIQKLTISNGNNQIDLRQRSPGIYLIKFEHNYRAYKIVIAQH